MTIRLIIDRTITLRQGRAYTGDDNLHGLSPTYNSVEVKP